MRLLAASVLVAMVAAAVLAAALAPASATAQDRDPTKRDFSAYRLRVDDAVEIAVYNRRRIEPEIEPRRVVVPANGEVSFAPVGKLQLLGRTTTEIEDLIAQRLRDENYLQEPVVGCFVTHYSPRTVSILGTAGTGTIELPTHRDLRILELLAKAGSLSNKSVDYTRVQVRRPKPDGSSFTVKVNVETILNKDDADEQNLVIREGDIVRLFEVEGRSPESTDWVYVTGKIGSPGRHPIIRGRFPFTLTRLVAICGDFGEFANTSKVKIIRTTETGRVFKEIDYDDIIEGKAPDFELRADDFIYVPERIF